MPAIIAVGFSGPIDVELVLLIPLEIMVAVAARAVVGAAVGHNDGAIVGLMLGNKVGVNEGAKLGYVVGVCVGAPVGARLGAGEGCFVGDLVGI